MADPAKKKVTLTNNAEGPRSFFAADGTQKILRSGESFEGEVLEAELKDLNPDIVQGKAAAKKAAAKADDADGGKGGGAADAAKLAEAAEAISKEAEELAEKNDEAALRQIAADEKVAGVTADDKKADIALKIAQQRATRQ